MKKMLTKTKYLCDPISLLAKHDPSLPVAKSSRRTVILMMMPRWENWSSCWFVGRCAIGFDRRLRVRNISCLIFAYSYLHTTKKLIYYYSLYAGRMCVCVNHQVSPTQTRTQCPFFKNSEKILCVLQRKRWDNCFAADWLKCRSELISTNPLRAWRPPVASARLRVSINATSAAKWKSPATQLPTSQSPKKKKRRWHPRVDIN